MRQLQFSLANFKYLEEENEKLHDLVQELTARLTIQTYDNLPSDPRAGSDQRPKSSRQRKTAKAA